MDDARATLLEHTDRISAIEATCRSCQDNVLAGIQVEVSRLNDKIGEEPDPDSGVDGHGLLRKMSRIADNLDVFNREREQSAKDKEAAEKHRAALMDRVKTGVTVVSVVVAVLGLGINFMKAHVPTADAAPVPSIVDASESR